MTKIAMIEAMTTAYFEEDFLNSNAIEIKYFYKLFNKDEQDDILNGEQVWNYFEMYKKIYTQIFKDYNLNLKFVDIHEKNGPWKMFTIDGTYEDFKKFYDMGTMFKPNYGVLETISDFENNEDYYVWYQ